MTSHSRSHPSPWNATSFEAAVQKAYIDQGFVKVVGETTKNGRRALITETAPPKWKSDNPNSKTIAVVDAETFDLYERTTFDGALFRQEAEHSRAELVDESSGLLAKKWLSTGAPTPDMAIQSEWRGIVGDRIDLVEDLGIEKTRFTQIRAVLRPAHRSGGPAGG